MIRLVYALIAVLASIGSVGADTLRMAVTTSFENSGLADVLLPEFTKDTGHQVELIVVGTGQAIRIAQAGDVDALLVHSKGAEEAFVADGYGPHRREIMYNDFVFIGPAKDPAQVGKATSSDEALRSILAAEAIFISRGDDSGTHRKELSLWARSGARPDAFGPWYRAVGAGMGGALNIAVALNSYIIADRASWLNFGNKGELKVLFSGDPALFNQYAFLPVSATRHPHVKAGLAAEFETWLVSQKAEDLINSYKINGETLFTFNANRK